MTGHITLHRAVTAQFGSLELTGELVLVPGGYPNGRDALYLQTDEGPEHISTNLPDRMLPPGKHVFFVKDYSGHNGLAQSLADSGTAEILGTTFTGPFDSWVQIIKLI